MGIGLALAGLGKFAGGYAEGMQQRQRQEREDAELAMRQAQAKREQDEYDRAANDRIALRNAAAPANVQAGAGGMTKPDTMDNRDVGQPDTVNLPNGGLLSGVTVNGTAYPDQQSADAAAAKYNAPEARTARISDTLVSQGRPDAAIKLQEAQLGLNAAKRKEADDAWRGKVGQAMQGGHQGLADLLTKTESGPFAGKKVEAVPSADGKSVTYNLVGDDGTKTPTRFTFSNDMNGVIQAGYLADSAVTPQHRMEMMLKEQELSRKEGDSEAKRQMWLTQAEGVIKRLELQGQLNDAKMAAAALKAQQSGQQVSREERMRFTTLFTDAGRRLQDAQKTYRTLTTGMDGQMFLKRANQNPNGPEAKQLAAINDDIAAYKQERDMWQGFLAPAGGTAAPSLKDAKPAAGAKPASLPMPKTKGELQAGKVYDTARGPAKWNGTAFEAQ